jgi:hypothetical protein
MNDKEHPMTASPGKAPNKEKEKKQTAEERLAAMRYNHMLYGPTAGEMRPVAKKVDYGASYLKHPKFLGLMAAFKKGAAFEFNVTDKGKVCTIATQESHISFDGKIIYYSRPLNRHEDNLLLDRTTTIQFQRIDAFVHFVFAVLRSFPELGTPKLSYLRHQFHHGAEPLEDGVAAQGPNLLIGSYKHNNVQEKPKK